MVRIWQACRSSRPEKIHYQLLKDTVSTSKLHFTQASVQRCLVMVKPKEENLWLNRVPSKTCFLIKHKAFEIMSNCVWTNGKFEDSVNGF